ncbi:MAG: histidine kinase, partial [Synergistaceae bacterium]|nr:histidine kinase [Synergistaceae bacterium]
MREFLGKHALLTLISAIIFLALSALLVGGYTLLAQERMLESVLVSYVRDMVRSLSEEIQFERGFGGNGHSGHMGQSSHHFMTSGPSLQGGVMLIVSDGGEVISASPGAEELNGLFLDDMMNSDKNYLNVKYNGVEYIAAWSSIENTRDRVFFIIPREKLLAYTANSHRLLIGALLALVVGITVLVWGLWRYLVSPLREMASDVNALSWGQERFTPSGATGVWEVGVLENALRRQSETAMENEILKENRVRDIIAVQEDERARFSRELHDGPLQYVTAAIRRIQIIAALLKNAPAGCEGNAGNTSEAISENLSEAEKAALFSAEEIRDLCDEMSPSWLDLGFPSALTELTERAAKQNEMHIELVFSDEARNIELTQEKSLALLRMFQEAYSNAVRHGQAKKIDVEFSLDRSTVGLAITDNGVGFDIDET